MYNDMYNVFEDVEFGYNYPFTFDEQNRSYLIKKDNPDYKINGKEESIIRLNIPDIVEATLKVVIRDFKYDVAYELDDIEYQRRIDLVLKECTLKSGLYLLEVFSNGINNTDDIILRKVVLVK